MNASFLHPILAHFPIALIIISSALIFMSAFSNKQRVSCLRIFACWLLNIGALMSVVTLISGFALMDEMVGIVKATESKHIVFAMLTTVVSVIAASVFSYCIYRSTECSVWRFLGYLLCFIAAGLVFMTAYYGTCMSLGLS